VSFNPSSSRTHRNYRHVRYAFALHFLRDRQGRCKSKSGLRCCAAGRATEVKSVRSKRGRSSIADAKRHDEPRGPCAGGYWAPPIFLLFHLLAFSLSPDRPPALPVQCNAIHRIPTPGLAPRASWRMLSPDAPVRQYFQHRQHVGMHYNARKAGRSRKRYC
jgi:hypothetical protein